MSKQEFKNSAKPIDKTWMGEELDPHDYGYDRPSDYMRLYSRLLQIVVSQAATYKFSGEFHKRECGIYKAEGGCLIPGSGDMVLGERCCYFDSDLYRLDDSKSKTQQCAELITKVVLEWDPMDPVNSMLKSASDWLGMDFEKYKAGVESSECGGVFGGDALWTFFGPNSRFDALEIRDYRRYCMVSFQDMTEEDADQVFSDEDLGRKLKAEINTKLQNAADKNSRLVRSVMCCRPQRSAEGVLQFWINTGLTTKLDGWKTEAEINAFLESDGVRVYG